MISGIKKRKGVIVITGEVGVGKTILIYALLKDLSEEMKTAFIFNPRVDFKNILENILRDLKAPIGEKGENLFSLLVHFRKYVNEKLTQGYTVAIVIDEAQSLDEEVLENLYRLATPDSPATHSLQILLVGHPEVELKLNSEKLRPYKDKISLHYHISPLTREESRDYINYRLNLVGQNISGIFTSQAVDRIWEYAGGIPRVMNLLCDRALRIGFRSSSQTINSRIVNQAIRDLGYLKPRKSKSFPPFLSQKKSRYRLLKILFLLFSVGIFFLSLSKMIDLLLRT